MKGKQGFQKGHGVFEGTQATQFKKGQKPWNDTNTYKACLNCGKAFKLKPSHFDKTKFCSNICYRNYIKIHAIGSSNIRDKICPDCGKMIMRKSSHCRSCSQKGLKFVENPGYSSLHKWMTRNYGQPKYCENCGSKHKGVYNWANISHEYKRERSDWMRLCRKCHLEYDSKTGWGVATMKFIELRERTKYGKIN